MVSDLQNLENIDLNANNSSEEISVSDTASSEARVMKPKVDKLGRAYATGKRKTSIARVWAKKGTGKITVNGLDFSKYFLDVTNQHSVLKPLCAVDGAENFDVLATVRGGGVSGQAGAVSHGIARALYNFDPLNLRQLLKNEGLLTRDARKVERKKPGQPKARKKEQFSKR